MKTRIGYGVLVACGLLIGALPEIACADTEKFYDPPKRKPDDPFPAPAAAYDHAKLKMEDLGRGVVAVKANPEGDVCVSWRYLSKDPRETGFNIYRNRELITQEPVTNATWFLDKGAYKGDKLGYEVRPVMGGHEFKRTRGRWVIPENAPTGCFDIPLEPVPDDMLRDGSKHGHHFNDCSVGDVDGDGEYELIVKCESNAERDNIGGDTGKTKFACVTMQGKRLWMIDVGFNINAGPHYQPFLVADFDCDGKAEFICRTAPGTTDGTGRVLQDDGTWVKATQKLKERDECTIDDFAFFEANGMKVTDHRGGGHPLWAPETLTIFNGETGEAMDTVPYNPPFVHKDVWGDFLPKGWGNRSHRFLATTAYLDGVRPSAVMCRGYYAKSCLAAWDWDGKSLRERWFFDSESPRWAGKGFGAQGFHNLRASDIDFDGKDEIIYGSMCVDHDGTGMNSCYLGHGDQVHICQTSPEWIGQQVFTCHESGSVGINLRDARTAECIWRVMSGRDVGNCLCGDFDPAVPGMEFFGSAGIGQVTMDGFHHGPGRSRQFYYITHRMAITWAGDMVRSLLPGAGGIWWYGVRAHGGGCIYGFEDVCDNNASKANPCLLADFLGDWREEVAWRKVDGSGIRVYVSCFPTDLRFWSFMEDPCYRNGVAAENAGYNVCPEPSFYFGPDLRGHGIWFRGCYIQ